jgi:hypothetical protein
MDRRETGEGNGTLSEGLKEVHRRSLANTVHGKDVEFSTTPQVVHAGDGSVPRGGSVLTAGRQIFSPASAQLA